MDVHLRGQGVEVAGDAFGGGPAIRFAVDEFAQRREGGRHGAEVKPGQGDLGGQRVGPAGGRGLESELAAPAQRAFGDLALDLREGHLFLGDVQLQRDVLRDDPFGVGLADAHLRLPELLMPERRGVLGGVRLDGFIRRFGFGLGQYGQEVVARHVGELRQDLPLGAFTVLGLLDEELAFGDAVGFDADADRSVEPLRLRRVAAAQRDGLELAFAVLEREFREVEGGLDLAGGRDRGRRRVAAGRDEVERFGERLLRHGAEIPLQAHRGGCLAHAPGKVARGQDAALVRQLRLGEREHARLVAEAQVQAGREVATADPEFVAPAHARVDKRHGRAFGADEKPARLEADDDVGALQVAGEFQAGDQRGERFQRKLGGARFDEHAHRLFAGEGEGLAQLDVEEVLAGARDARFQGVQGRGFAGFRAERGLGEDPDARELVLGEVFPARLLREFGDADLGVGGDRPSAIFPGPYDRIADRDLPGGGAQRKRGDEDGAPFRAQGELRIHFLQEDFAGALERQARERVRLDRRDGRFALDERQFGFPGPAASGGRQVGHRQEGRQRDEVGVAGRQGQRRLRRELAVGEAQGLGEDQGDSIAGDIELLDVEAVGSVAGLGLDHPRRRGVARDGGRELREVGPGRLYVRLHGPGAGERVRLRLDEAGNLAVG